MIQMLEQSRNSSDDCRSIYLPIVRDQVPDSLAVFDFPDASLVSGRREESNVPSQALFLLNDDEVVSLARSFADRVSRLPGTTPDRLAEAFEIALGRRPGRAERSVIDAFWADFVRRHARRIVGTTQDGDSMRAEGLSRAQSLALVAYCQALFATAEFRHLN